MKRFSAVYLVLFLSVFFLLLLNLEFFSALVPGWDASVSSFWDSGEVMIVGMLVVSTLVISTAVIVIFRLFSIVFRKLE